MFGNYSAGSIIDIIITIIISLTIHEAMHAYVGYKLGDVTAMRAGRISLNPLKHIDPFTTIALPILTLILFHAPILAARPVPFNPVNVRFGEFGSALIAAAGPLSNLVLAIIGALLYRVVTMGVLSDFLAIFVVINVTLFVFNMIPIPPLDGSRVLYALAPEPVQRFMESIEPYGIFIVFGLVLFGGLSTVLINLEQMVLRLLP